MNKHRSKLISLVLAAVLVTAAFLLPMTATALAAEEPLVEPETEYQQVVDSQTATPTDITIPSPVVGADGYVPLYTQPNLMPMMSMALAATSGGSWTEYGKPGHSSASGDTVSFAGHPMDPFTQLLFRAASDGDYRILTFHLTEGNSDWHTLEGTGFVFNAGISGGVLSGYAVIFRQTDVGFYRLTNVNMSALAGSTFTMAPGVTLIDQKPKPAYSAGTTWILKLVMSPGTLKVEKYADAGYTQLAETIFSTTLNDTSGGSGYGPFASFLSHDCPSISTSLLEYFNLTIKPNTPPVVTAPDVTINRGGTFNPNDGVSASDAEDGDLTAQVQIQSSNVNNQIPSVYQVVYTVSDIVGASANHTRKVTVLADAVFVATEKGTGKPISGVGVTVQGIGALPATDAKGEASIILPTGSYAWQISKQHPDYLPLTGSRSVQIDSVSFSTWPARIPFELEKKYNDVGVTLVCKQTDAARYGDTVTFTLTVTNNGNQTSIPTVALTAPEGLSLIGDASITTGALALRASKSLDICCKVTSLKDSETLTLTATLTKLVLDADKAVVPDENPVNDKTEAKINIKNPPTILVKKDAISKAPLAGVELQVIKDGKAEKFKKLENGSWVVDASGVDTLPTDKDGKLTLYGLSPATYAIHEAKPLPGYALPKKDWGIVRDAEGKTTGDTELFNEPNVVTLTKLDSLTQSPLSGAEFKLTSKDGKVVKLTRAEDGSYHPDEKGAEIVVSDKDGKITLSYLPAGEYLLKENKAPTGYALSKKEWAFRLSDKGEVSGDTKLINDPTALELTKTDALYGVPLAGVEFTLTDKDGKVLTANTDAQGKIIWLRLPIGDYTLTETKAPEGYATAEPVKVAITDDHTAQAPKKVAIADKPLALKILKVTRAGQPLSGAGFAVKTQGFLTSLLTFSKGSDGIYRYDTKGTVTTVMVNDNGEALVYGLPLGAYLLEETVVPNGYIAVTQQAVTITNDTTTDKPREARIVNDEVVKLGFDSDRVYVPLAVGLLLIALAGVVIAMVKSQRMVNEGGEQ